METEKGQLSYFVQDMAYKKTAKNMLFMQTFEALTNLL
jgi:hypothetical protein